MRSACVKLCGIPAPRLLDTLQVYAELIRGARASSRSHTCLDCRVGASGDPGTVIFPVKFTLGLIFPIDASLPSAELDLGPLVGFIVVEVLGPGRPSAAQLLGIEKSSLVVA